ncbi:MAG TPA: hypothetical protein VF702_01495 [Allosphingosinicella sp.]|jgi:hypothetical protein
MNNKAALAVTAALVLVAGCNGGSDESANAANSVGGGSANVPAVEGAPLTAAALVGTWGQAGCTNAMTFAADGTASSTSAEQTNNRWSLDGSTIVITSPGEADVRMPATLSGNELRISGGGGEGQSTVLTRCEVPSAAAGNATDGENEAVEENAE